jgi:hypothetical protein
VHRRVGQANDYWSFTIIWRRISHSHSILRLILDAQTVTLLHSGFNRWFAPDSASGSGPEFAEIQFRKVWVG